MLMFWRVIFALKLANSGFLLSKSLPIYLYRLQTFPKKSGDLAHF